MRPGADGASPAGGGPVGVPWSIVHGLALVVASVLGPAVVVAGVVVLGVDLEASLTRSAVGGQALLITLAGMLAWLARTGRLTPRLLGPARSRPWRAAGVGVLVGAAATACAVGAGWATRMLMGAEGVAAALDPAPTRPVEVVAALVVAGLVAPVVTTLAHHAVLLQALLRRLPTSVAVTLSAVVYAIAAPGPLGAEAVVSAAVLGAFLAVMFVRAPSVVMVFVMQVVAGLLGQSVRFLLT